MSHRKAVPVLVTLFLLGMALTAFAAPLGTLGVGAQESEPGNRSQVSTPVPVLPHLEPVPTPTPTVDPITKEEIDRQLAAAVDPLSSPPPHDDFNDAISISSLPYQHSIDTSGATVAMDDPDMGCGFGVNSNTVWYRLNAPSSRLVEASTFGSNYDTVLAVFTGTRGSLNWVACNDDAAGTLQSHLIFEVEAGRTYYLEVADYASPGGGVLDIEVKVDPSGASKARRLEPGDDLIHGFTYYDGFLWASTRTHPARILRIDPDTLDYERIVLSSGLNEGEDLIAAAGYIWVILFTDPARVVRIDPETLQWQVAITFGSGELSWGGSLEYAFGYLWAGGYDRKIARIDLNDLSYQTYTYPTVTSYSQFHALTSGGGYIWASAPHYSSWQGWYGDTIVRISPDDPTDYSTVYVDRAMSDDIAYSDTHLFTGSEFTAGSLYAPSYIYRFGHNLTYDSVYAFDHGSYGVFAHNGDVWSAHIASPGKTIEFNTSLEIESTHDLPIGFNNANEIAFDPEGNRYVTAWESPAAIVQFSSMPSPGPVDLSIDSVVPVQVLEGQDLVLYKPTAVKVVVRKTGTDPLNNVQVRVAYDGRDRTSFYVSESGNWDANFILQEPNTAYPLNFASDETTKAVYFFASALTPRSSGTYQVVATVDHEDAIAEANEGNNTASSAPLQVRDTDWTGNQHPELYVRFFRSDWGSTSDSLFYDYHDGSRHYILAAYPVSPVDFDTSFAESWEGNSSFWRGSDGRLNPLEFFLWAAQLSTEARLSTRTADRFISVMPPDWFANYTTEFTEAAGVAFPSLRTVVFAEVLTDPDLRSTARYVPAAHELGHSYGLRLDCEEYYHQDANCLQKTREHAPPDRIGEEVGRGLWVDHRMLMEHSTQHPVYCFMGSVAYVSYWIDGDCYSGLLDDHEVGMSAAEPGHESTDEAILVVGHAFITNTIELENWYILPEAQIDDLPQGDYSLRYLDAADLLLYEHPFDISFTVEGIATTMAPFVFTAPHVPGTARIVVRYETTDLAEKIVTSNAPTVTVLAPNGGEILLGETTIEWLGNDGDGDTLSYAILYSPDGGSEWNTLTTGRDTTTYEWDLKGLPPGPNYVVKVIATDGINTGQDTSDGTFTVHGQALPPQAFLPAIIKNY